MLFALLLFYLPGNSFFFSNSGSSQTSHSKVGNIDVSLEIGNLPDQKVQKHNNDSLQAMVGTGNGIMDAIQILSTLLKNQLHQNHLNISKIYIPGYIYIYSSIYIKFVFNVHCPK